MNLGAKLRIAKQAIDSILTHDDEPADAREQAAAILKAHIDADMVAAREREQARILASLQEPPVEA